MVSGETSKSLFMVKSLMIGASSSCISRVFYVQVSIESSREVVFGL